MWQAVPLCADPVILESYTELTLALVKQIRIIHRCWQTGRPYDEEHYLSTLKKRSSPLIPIIQELINQEAKTT